MNLDEYINIGKIGKLVKKALSDDELKKILGNDLKIIMYPNLEKYSTIEMLLPKPNDYCVILIVENENKFLIEGHWTALLRYDDLYEFFDPYGNDVDYDLIHWLDKKQLAKLHENKKYLTSLLDGKEVIHNQVKYEVLRKGVNTCGSHCCYRIYNFIKKGMALPEYQKHMHDVSKEFGLGYDKIVSAFVRYFLT